MHNGKISRAFLAIATGLLLLAMAGWAGHASAPSPEGAFRTAVVDFGVCVSDIERSAAFYRDALGFTEVPGFDVSGKMAGDSGLTDYRAFKVRVFALSEAGEATKVKLIQFPGVKPRKNDNRYIQSSLGVRYLTIHVADTTAAVAKAKSAGAAVLARGPCDLGGNNYLTLVRDPDGNMIELVGPRR